MDTNALLEMIMGSGAPQSAATPKLTRKTRNLPQQAYDKTKKYAKENPGGDTAPVEGAAGDPIIEGIISMLLGGDMSQSPAGMDVTPQMRPSTRAMEAEGKAYPNNFNPMSAQLKQIAGMLGLDPEQPAGDAPYGDSGADPVGPGPGAARGSAEAFADGMPIDDELLAQVLQTMLIGAR